MLQPILQPLLEELGLSPIEAKIYEALITYGGSGVSTIALRAKVHRRNAYDAVNRLLEKGLVFRVHTAVETLYQAVEPMKLLEFLREREMKLTSLLPNMQKLYLSNRAPELAYIYKGVEGVKNYMREALRTGKDMHILGAEGAWLDPRIITYTRWFLAEAKKKKMKIYSLLDHDARALPEATTLLATDYKFLPENYNTDSTQDVFGDYVVTYTGTAPGHLLEDCTIFVMFSPELAESYRTWWQLIWDLLPREKRRKQKRKK